jgi:hypothetical protein
MTATFPSSEKREGKSLRCASSAMVALTLESPLLRPIFFLEMGPVVMKVTGHCRRRVYTDTWFSSTDLRHGVEMSAVSSWRRGRDSRCRGSRSSPPKQVVANPSPPRQPARSFCHSLFAKAQNAPAIPVNRCQAELLGLTSEFK